MLLDGVNHIAWISKDVGRLGRFYEQVFDAVIGPTRGHGPGETMTVIDIGPATQLNVFVIDGNTEADRQTPMWGRGRIDHVGLTAASPDAFEVIRGRLIDTGASDGTGTSFPSGPTTFPSESESCLRSSLLCSAARSTSASRAAAATRRSCTAMAGVVRLPAVPKSNGTR